MRPPPLSVAYAARNLPDFTCRNMATERQITCCEIKAADAELPDTVGVSSHLAA